MATQRTRAELFETLNDFFYRGNRPTWEEWKDFGESYFNFKDDRIDTLEADDITQALWESYYDTLPEVREGHTNNDIDQLINRLVTTPSLWAGHIVETAQDVRDLDPTVFRTVETLGAETPGDGGGAAWAYNDLLEDADDLGSTLLTTGNTGAGRWRTRDQNIIIARRFGTPNGTGDAAKLRKAIEAAFNITGSGMLWGGNFTVDTDFVGGTVLLDYGVWEIDETIITLAERSLLKIIVLPGAQLNLVADTPAFVRTGTYGTISGQLEICGGGSIVSVLTQDWIDGGMVGPMPLVGPVARCDQGFLRVHDLYLRGITRPIQLERQGREASNGAYQNRFYNLYINSGAGIQLVPYEELGVFYRLSFGVDMHNIEAGALLGPLIEAEYANDLVATSITAAHHDSTTDPVIRLRNSAGMDFDLLSLDGGGGKAIKIETDDVGFVSQNLHFGQTTTFLGQGVEVDGLYVTFDLLRCSQNEDVPLHIKDQSDFVQVDTFIAYSTAGGHTWDVCRVDGVGRVQIGKFTADVVTTGASLDLDPGNRVRIGQILMPGGAVLYADAPPMSGGEWYVKIGPDDVMDGTYEGQGETADATPANLWVGNIQDDYQALVTTEVQARAGADFATWKLHHHVYGTGGGAASYTINAAASDPDDHVYVHHCTAGAAAWLANTAIGASRVRLEVTGAAATNIAWGYKITVNHERKPAT